MSGSDIILSVLVISHNQKSQVKRCLDSVLSQNIPFEYEIVISDDASTDGTWKLEQEYAAKYPFIKCWQCNSDDCHPTITSERSGHNRSNAYAHSSGKYFAHIDADDWYRPGSHCLEQQVNLLEEHPECSMCMQDEWCWEEGAPLECGHANHTLHRFKTGEILSAEDFFRKDVLMNNGVMMIRRRAEDEPLRDMRKWYVDNFITTYYLQFGPIVCLDRNDWIYTQASNTITNSICRNDMMLLWGLDATVFLACHIPSMKKMVYLSPSSRSMLLDSIRCILTKVPISQKLIDFCAQFDDVFVFRVAAKNTLSMKDIIRLFLAKQFLKFYQRGRLETMCLDLLHTICC